MFKHNKILFATLILCIALGLSACGSADTSGDTVNLIDADCKAKIAGDYQITGQEDNYWHLHISADEPDEGDNDFSIYDNYAGNPGVEGVIVSLDETKIKVKYDEDLYDALPSDKWEINGDYLEVTYEVTDSGITLTNSGESLNFEKE